MSTRLIILYSKGGLSDVGRHAVQVAVEKGIRCTVLTQYPELLEEETWKCGCPDPHQFTVAQRELMEIVKVESWEDHESITAHFKDAKAVVFCLGNRQPFIGAWDSHEGCKAVIAAMNAKNIRRVVALSSMGIEEDWPPMEWYWAGRIMAAIFLTIGRASFNDLTQMERKLRASDLDFLLVRPVGIGEDVKPVGKWYFQKEKYKDTLGFNMAKLDVARFMVQEALEPTIHQQAVVIGAEPPGQH